MYVILDGAVEIKDPESGTIFASLETDFFGELALLDEELDLLLPRYTTLPSNRFFRTDL